MPSFLQRHVATAVLIVELSTLSAVIAFMIAATLGYQTHGFA
jgi:hypothetical protein